MIGLFKMNKYIQILFIILTSDMETVYNSHLLFWALIIFKT